jgi:hypothetical protein
VIPVKDPESIGILFFSHLIESGNSPLTTEQGIDARSPTLSDNIGE